MSFSESQANETVSPQVNKLAKAALIANVSAVVVILCGAFLTIIMPHAFFLFETVFIGFGTLASAIGLLLSIAALLQMKKEPGQEGKVLAILSIVIGLPILLLGFWTEYLVIFGS